MLSVLKEIFELVGPLLPRLLPLLLKLFAIKAGQTKAEFIGSTNMHGNASLECQECVDICVGCGCDKEEAEAICCYADLNA